MKKTKFVIGMFVASIFAMLSGCSEESAKGFSGSRVVLDVVAGSEIKSIEPVLKEMEKATGVALNIKYTGTIEGVEEVRTGAYDVAWFGNNKYFYDDAQVAKKIKLSEKIMFSPVIVGVKESSVAKYKIDPSKSYTWKDISKWVSEKGMRYAMTDPSVSNSGYVALLGIVYSSANKGKSVKVEDVNEKVLQKFFEGQKLTAKSSNWIMEKFNKDSEIDFVINYESTVLNNSPKLVPIYPNEGIVTSDYPMMLINDKKVEAYKTVVEYLKGVAVQKRLVNEYKYRAANSEAMMNQTVFDTTKLLVEMPFSPESDLSDEILSAYFNKYKKPAKFAFVLDVSGSMAGSRERMMKESIDKLVKGEISKFAKIREREEVFVIPFSDQVFGVSKFTSDYQKEMNTFVSNLRMGGGTAMYNAVAEGIIKLYEDKKVNGDKYRYSVIVLTDGVSNQGASYEEFKNWYYKNKMDKEGIKVFAIHFGDADMNQLNNLAGVTEGSVFDGQKSLAGAFKEIRAYQ